MPAPAVTPATQQHGDAPERKLTTAEVAALADVHPSTVRDWANTGKLQVTRTLGGHRRYRESEVRALFASLDSQAGAA